MLQLSISSESASYTSELLPDCRTLYLISKDSLPLVPSHSQALSFLCIGKPSPDLLVHPDDQYLFFAENTDPAALLQEVQEIFLFFHLWETRMYELICRRASLMELCAHCLELTENPLCPASSDMRILAFGERENKPRELKMFLSMTWASTFLMRRSTHSALTGII